MPTVVLHLSGFGKFDGVSDNPTAKMMECIREYLKDNPLDHRIPFEIASVTVFEVSKEGTSAQFNELLQKNLPQNPDQNDNKIHLFVHFGVHGGATTFLLEQVAWNELDFRVPDERGFQPTNLCISNEGDTMCFRKTMLPLEDIREALIQCPSFQGQTIVELSTDPGRFLCNYLYYISLTETSKINAHSLFVHVPPFETIPKEIQLEFVKQLLNELCKSCCK